MSDWLGKRFKRVDRRTLVIRFGTTEKCIVCTFVNIATRTRKNRTCWLLKERVQMSIEGCSVTAARSPDLRRKRLLHLKQYDFCKSLRVRRQVTLHAACPYRINNMPKKGEGLGIAPTYQVASLDSRSPPIAQISGTIASSIARTEESNCLSSWKTLIRYVMAVRDTANLPITVRAT